MVSVLYKWFNNCFFFFSFGGISLAWLLNWYIIDVYFCIVHQSEFSDLSAMPPISKYRVSGGLIMACDNTVYNITLQTDLLMVSFKTFCT